MSDHHDRLPRQPTPEEAEGVGVEPIPVKRPLLPIPSDRFIQERIRRRRNRKKRLRRARAFGFHGYMP